jgi:hypothetical protein
MEFQIVGNSLKLYLTGDYSEKTYQEFATSSNAIFSGFYS